MSTFKEYEKQSDGFSFSLSEALNNIKFNSDGLVPTIAQQFDSKEVLMMAWMNKDAIQETLKTGRVCYWSRSRKGLWRKGESSGQVQRLKSFSLDCDGDTILLSVDQTGPACHTGRRSCFFYKAVDDQVTIEGKVLISPEDLYKQ